MHVSTDYVFDGTQRRPYLESDLTEPDLRLRPLEAGGRDVAWRSRTRGTSSSARPGSTATRGGNFIETMLRLAGEQPEVVVVSDQIGSPTYTRHLAPALAELAEGEEFGIHHVAASGRCSWFEFAQEIFDQAGVECRVMATTTEMLGRPAPRPPVLGARLGTTGCPGAARVARGPARVPARARGGCRRMSRVLVTGGAGFIGSGYVRHRLASHPGDEVRVLDKLTYAGRRENLEGVEGCELVVGDIADADAVAAAIEGCDALVNFAAESHVDRSIEAPGEFIQTDVYGTYVLLEAARHAGIRYLQISTDEVYGSIADGSFTESSPLDPSSPYSASKAGGDLLVGAYAAHV